MQLDVDKADLHHVRALSRASRPLEVDEARIRIDRFGLSANNITYAVFGELMQYWACFPGPGPDDAADGVDWGRVPVWGFGDVVESRAPGLAEGRRIYGYFPLADELVVRPRRHDDQGFSDGSPGRDAVPSVYARYGYVDIDPIYSVEREAQQMLLWPLFVTSFVVDDFLADHGLFGAETVVVSSASAKTAIGAAFLLSDREGVEVVGLTSAANLGFVRALGCYSTVLTYEEIDDLALADSCYVDVAGRRDITHAVHARLGDRLRYSMVVGDTHWDNTGGGDGPPPGPRPEFLFAPDQIAKRRTDWGRAGFESAVAAAWSRFVPWTDGWLVLRDRTGPAEVEAAYRDLLDGRVDPRTGDICTLSEGGPERPGRHRVGTPVTDTADREGTAPAAPDLVPSATEASGDDASTAETDGRRLRRAVNREAVVDALLDLYSEGNLRPGTDAIAERAGISPRSLFRYFEDTDDLTDEAINRQLARARPLVRLDAGVDAPFEERIRALVDQRFRLFDVVGQAARVSRLRAPFHPRLAETLAESRRFLRGQVRSLFAAEFDAMGPERAPGALAAADVLATFETYQLLTVDQELSETAAKDVISRALTLLLSVGGAP